jgi:hypothetical protein
MKKIVTILALVLTSFSYAQNVGINSTGAAPNTSAMLDVDAAPNNDKGLLIPRVPLLATNNALPVTTPANSLVVYNTATAGISPNNVVPGFYYWNGTKWIAFGGSGGSDWSLTGNAGTVAGTNFIGTTDAVDFSVFTNNIERIRVLSNGNVGIGTSTPLRLLHVGNGINAAHPNTDIALTEAGGANIAVRETGNGVEAMMFVDNANVYYGSFTNFPVIFRQNNLNRAIIDNAGNVGIGTPTPTEKLDVAGSIRASIAPVKSGSSNPYGLYMYTDNSFTTYIDALTSATFGVNMHLRTYLNGTYNTILFGDQFGNDGIGTTVPAAKLDVFSANTGVGQSSAGGLLFQVQDGLSRAAIAAYGNIDGILPNGTGCALAVREQTGTGRSINASGTINASGADYAEYFYQEAPGSLKKGDVVCLASDGKVKKSSTTEQLIGVVSTKPGVVGNDVFDQNNPDETVLVGLVGQVPVNTTTENGVIQTGDYLTPSLTKPGYAMKSTQPEKIIGIALEPLTKGDGKIMVYINIGEGNIISSIKEQQVTIKKLDERMDQLKAENKQQLDQLKKEIEEIKSDKKKSFELLTEQ